MQAITLYSYILVIASLQSFANARQFLYDAAIIAEDVPGRGGVTVYGDCVIDINKDIKEPGPIITPAGQVEWWETNKKGVLEINNGQWLDLYCEKSFVAPFNNRVKLRAQCLQDTYFLVDGKIYAYNNISCTSWPTYVARRTGRPCNMGTDLLEVGYQLSEDVGFLKTMDICHDEEQEATRYSYYTMNPGNILHQSGVNRPSFLQKDYYGSKNVNQLYTKVRQQATFAEILQKDVSVYFTDSNDYFLARGHLGAKADFVYATAQRATFLFLNVAPQWQSFNGGNWEAVESSVRNYVGNENLYADIYTGVWGVSTLPDINNEPKQLYLDFDSNGNGLIPVPMLYYRIVIDRKSNNGIVLIGVNNPHASLQEIQRDYIICTDISDVIDWVNWDKHNLKRGYSYACSVADFIAVVPDLPVQLLNITGILGVESEYAAKFL